MDEVKTAKRGPYQKARAKSDDAAVRVALSAGSVTLMFKGNVFDLTPVERKLMSDLTDVIRQFEATKPASGDGQ